MMLKTDDFRIAFLTANKPMVDKILVTAEDKAIIDLIAKFRGLGRLGKSRFICDDFFIGELTY